MVICRYLYWDFEDGAVIDDVPLRRPDGRTERRLR